MLCLIGCGDGSTSPDLTPGDAADAHADPRVGADTDPAAGDVSAPQDDTGPTATPLTCAYLNDGVCDEPVNCPLSTDVADCADACNDPEVLWLYGAACAHRQPVRSQPNLPPVTPGDINTSGTHDRTIDVQLGAEAGTRPRHYRLFVPPGYDPDQAWPLVVMMPGHRVDIYSLADYTQLEAAAEMNGFLLAYAEQEWRSDAFKWAWWTDWSWSSKPDTNPDVAFLADLVDDVAQGWSLDKDRVYGVGHSRGGAMAYIAAFELSHVFAALCSQSGFIEFGFDTHVVNYTGRKTPIMLVHGSVDTDVPVARSDAMNAQLQGLGWAEDALVYHRLDKVAHRWQPWMNQQVWGWLSGHRLDGGTP
jgi:poly(3-hydroxybutyrate) depolymerase